MFSSAYISIVGSTMPFTFNLSVLVFPLASVALTINKFSPVSTGIFMLIVFLFSSVTSTLISSWFSHWYVKYDISVSSVATILTSFPSGEIFIEK